MPSRRVIALQKALAEARAEIVRLQETVQLLDAIRIAQWREIDRLEAERRTP